jgi:hypothetical protein
MALPAQHNKLGPHIESRPARRSRRRKNRLQACAQHCAVAKPPLGPTGPGPCRGSRALAWQGRIDHPETIRLACTCCLKSGGSAERKPCASLPDPSRGPIGRAGAIREYQSASGTTVVVQSYRHLQMDCRGRPYRRPRRAGACHSWPRGAAARRRPGLGPCLDNRGKRHLAYVCRRPSVGEAPSRPSSRTSAQPRVLSALVNVRGSMR